MKPYLLVDFSAEDGQCKVYATRAASPEEAATHLVHAGSRIEVREAETLCLVHDGPMRNKAFEVLISPSAGAEAWKLIVIEGTGDIAAVPS